MNTFRKVLHTGVSSVCLAAGLLAPAASWAADKPARAACPYGQATDGSTHCMSKADFEVAKARQSALDRDPAQYTRNALQRCDSLKGDDRTDCWARIRGQGIATGSVEGGGIYRELVTREVGPVPAAAALPASAASSPSEPKQ